MDLLDSLVLIVLSVAGIWAMVTLALWLAWRRAERDCRDMEGGPPARDHGDL